MSRKAKVSLERLNDNLEEVLQRMGVVQSDLTTLKDTVNRISVSVSHIPEIESRLDNLEAEMKAVRIRMDNLEGLYQHLDKKLEILDHEYVSMSAALKRLEERFDRIEADQLRDRVRTLEERVTALEKSIVN